MKLLKWFYPGMKIKRWIALTVFGTTMLSMGFVIIISEEQGQASLGTSIVIIIGIIALITGVKRIINSLITIFLPEREKDLVDIVYKKRQLEKGPRIVAIGGGVGFTTVLRGLKEYTNNITAVVTVIDEGRVSSRMQAQSDIPPPAGVRESLIALADAELVVGNLFHYRFKKGTELWGYNFGDLFLTAMSGVMGDFDRAVKESSRVLAIRGQVALSTLAKVSLIAHHADGAETIGKENILNSTNPIKRVYLRPQSAKATQEVVSALLKAEAIVFCPGSLYTELMPALLVGGVKEELLNSKAVKIYIANIMTKSGETDNYKTSDHLKGIAEHVGQNLVNYCIVNRNRISAEQVKRYEQEGAEVVPVDKEGLTKFGCKVIEESIIDKTSGPVRHNPLKLAEIILNLISESKKAKVHSK
ncbi:MAG: uridine diphosphate-N-acetylglucosamine-binding protein YvcK [Candidatus Omnitrophica bacterium]|nr:uridine diphosphate-N-acetylglucosamine-binding protein YvcK [Candidatus Omnitrophota bacterium]